MTSEPGDVALIDVYKTVFVHSAEYGEDDEDNSMAPTPKWRKLCSQLGFKNVTGCTSKVFRL